MDPTPGPTPLASGSADPPSIVDLVARGVLDAELASLTWLLVEGDVPLVVAAPADRLGAAAQLLRSVLASIRPDADAPELAEPLNPTRGRRVIRGTRAGGIVAGTSLEDVFAALSAPPLPLAPEELTFLGCVLVLGGATAGGSGGTTGAGARGKLRVVAAHYVRPLARDAHGHAQHLGPAVLATWNAERGHYEHFAWGVLPEIAARLGRHGGDLERDLHHRRDDLAGLAQAGVTSLVEVRQLIAGYRAAYGQHAAEGQTREH